MEFDEMRLDQMTFYVDEMPFDERHSIIWC
jgi:hypothetical protein